MGRQKKKNFSDLSHYDIVLTTYGSLAAELKRMETFQLRQRHFPGKIILSLTPYPTKVFRAFGTPGQILLSAILSNAAVIDADAPLSETRPAANERCVLIGPDSNWYRVILDESQCIKNASIVTSKAACHLKAKFRFCVTGKSHLLAWEVKIDLTRRK